MGVLNSGFNVTNEGFTHMTKFLTLLAAIGLLAAPAFAVEGEKTAAPVAAKEAKMEAAKDCKNLIGAEKIACEKTDADAKKAPAAGKMETEKKAN
jgi:hypothetical protein